MSEGTRLFSNLVIRDTTIRNRIFVSPMCQYSCEDGVATSWHLVHLGSRAVGGAGLVMTEAAAVTPEGRISYADLGIWDDRQVDALRPVARFIREHSSVAAIQLAHAGRKASGPRPWDKHGWDGEARRTWQTVSSTARPFAPGSPVPRALTSSDSAALPGVFATASARAVAAGFQVVEIHAAHGYLLHQFLSPLCNDRSDEYGGTFDGRCRPLLEVAAAVRAAIGERVPLFVRISATDWHEDGWTIDDSVALAMRLRELGVDLVDCSSGGIIPGLRVPVGPGYQVHLAARVRRDAGINSGAVGLITTADQAEAIVRSGQADAVLLGREMLRNPYWPRDSARSLNQDYAVPPQYARAE
jgi:2,4-dienoyl-CoA reductase-like NADH-dependent reductase (Old Yellow Enzyme family)